MNSSNATGDDSQRLSPIFDDDHAGYLWIVTTLGITYTTLSAVLRGYIKWRLFGYDDYLLAAATLVHLGQSVAIFFGLVHGLAKFNTITTEQQWSMSGKVRLLTSNHRYLKPLTLTWCSPSWRLRSSPFSL
jgi:hypothetical protein